MDEYIDREAVLKKMHNWNTKERLIDCVKDAPAAEVAPVVHARWHDVYMVSPSVATGVCSHCDGKSYVSPLLPFALYCPHCGAKMDLE